MINRSSHPNDSALIQGSLKNLNYPFQTLIGNETISSAVVETNNINLNLPIDLEAGFYSLDLIMTDIGDFSKAAFFTLYSNEIQRFYEFLCIPILGSVNTNWGSPNGQIITITGLGFSNTTNNITVYAGLTPCSIILLSSFEIICEIKEDYYIDNKFYFQSSGILKTSYSIYLSLISMISSYLSGVPNFGNSSEIVSSFVVNEINEENNL